MQTQTKLPLKEKIYIYDSSEMEIEFLHAWNFLLQSMLRLDFRRRSRRPIIPSWSKCQKKLAAALIDVGGADV